MGSCELCFVRFYTLLLLLLLLLRCETWSMESSSTGELVPLPLHCLMSLGSPRPSTPTPRPPMHPTIATAAAQSHMKWATIWKTVHDSLGMLGNVYEIWKGEYLVNVSEVTDTEDFARHFVESNAESEVILFVRDFHNLVTIEPVRHHHGRHGVALPLRLLRAQRQAPRPHSLPAAAKSNAVHQKSFIDVLNESRVEHCR